MNHWKDEIWFVSKMISLEKYWDYGRIKQKRMSSGYPIYLFHCVECTHWSDSCGNPSVCRETSSTVYMTFPKYLLPLLPKPWQPQVRFLSLWVSFCFVSKFICIFFLDSMCKGYQIFLLFLVWFISLSMTLGPSLLLCVALFHSF